MTGGGLAAEDTFLKDPHWVEVVADLGAGRPEQRGDALLWLALGLVLVTAALASLLVVLR